MDTIHRQPVEEKVYREFLLESANEGFRLQSALADWKTTALTWSSTLSLKTSDLQMMLAKIYHYAISIYLSGTFDYFPYWDESHIATPTLTSSQIQAYVKAILGMVTLALKQTNLAGILFLFPLRVAGARAQSLQHRFEIARMLGDITRRGFVVADAFMMDLTELWERKSVAVALPAI
jgi:Fungal specific transcription factor domain